MRLNIVFLRTTKSLSRSDQYLLRKVIRRHVRRAARLLGIKLLNVTVYLNRDEVIPETGELGYAAGGDWIRLTIDPTRRSVRKIITDTIPATIYHEMHHIARHLRPGYGVTLLETMVSEGLATVFEEEQWPAFGAPWGRYTRQQIRRFIRLARRAKHTRRYSHDEWFFGKGKQRWLGYKLGAYIIRSAKDRNPKITAGKLVRTNARRILKMSGVPL